MKMVAALATCMSALSSLSHSAFALEDTVNPELFDKMEYRFIGPYRSGRSVAVTGGKVIPTFILWAPQVAVFEKPKTRVYRGQQYPIKTFKVGSIGAIVVAPSDPNVIYVGTGKGPIRGVTTSHGKGVYESTDGGEPWSSIYNQPTAQFYRVITDNLNPYYVYGGQQDNSTMATPHKKEG